MTTKKIEGDVVEFVPIETIDKEFGREDLNEVKDKVNAVIKAVNNLLTA